MASFLINGRSREVKVAVLDDHSETAKRLGLRDDGTIGGDWQEGHYLPNGVVTVAGGRRGPMVERVRARWKTFAGFLWWALGEMGQREFYHGSLDLSGVTSAKNLRLPGCIGGNLYLPFLKSAKNLVLPEYVGGTLYLSGVTSAKDLVLPKRIGGSLYLAGLTLAADLRLPKHVGGNLCLRGLKSLAELTLPDYLGGHLEFNGKCISFAEAKAEVEAAKAAAK
jgi:hypothetical protein